VEKMEKMESTTEEITMCDKEYFEVYPGLYIVFFYDGIKRIYTAESTSIAKKIGEEERPGKKVMHARQVEAADVVLIKNVSLMELPK